MWRNVANSNRRCLLISAPKVHWRVQPTAARRSGRFTKMHGALCALHVSLNNASGRIVSKWLNRKNGHLITLQTLNGIEISLFWRGGGATDEAMIKPLSEAQNSFWIKRRTKEDMKTIFAGSVNNAVLRFASRLTRVRERWRKTF